MYSFKRTFLAGQLTATQTGSLVILPQGISAAYVFKLSDLPNNSEFTTLFDQYKLRMVSVHFRPLVNQLVTAQPNTGTTDATGYCPLHTVIDYDDNSAPTSLSTVLQYQNLRTTNPNRPHKRIVRPKVLREVYQSSVTTAYQPSASGWIDCNYAGVPHYGLKVYMDPPPFVLNTSSSMTYQVYMTYYMSFKNVR